MAQVTSPIVLDSTGQDIASKLNTMNSKLEAIKNAVQPTNIYLDLELSIPTTAWSSSSPYTYTWSSAYITPECDIEVEFGDGAENVEMTYLEFEKVSGGVKFTVPSKPLSAVPVVIRVINADAEYIASVSATMVSTSAIPGQSNVEQALSNVDSRITTLNSNLTPSPFTITLPSGYSWNNYNGKKIGIGIIEIDGRIDLATPSTAKIIDLGIVIPSDLRPLNVVAFAAFNNSTDNCLDGRITSEGKLIFYRQETESLPAIAFHVIYTLW